MANNHTNISWKALPVALCITDPLFTVSETSQAFNALFKEELAGKCLESIFKGKSQFSKLATKLKRESRVFAFEAQIQIRNKEFFVSVSGLCLKKEKEISSYIFSFTDITVEKRRIKELEKGTRELKNTRKALMNILEDVAVESKRAETEKDKTTAVFKNFADGILMTEKNKITLINSKAEGFFDLRKEDVVGKDISELKQNKRIGKLVELLKEKKELSRENLFIEEGLVLEVSTTPVLQREEEIGALIIFHDITRERFIESLKTEFVSIAAHQLRTPLSAIKWILRMFIEGDLGSLSKQQKEYIEKAYVSNERMIKLINDLLNITRIEEGRFLYKTKRADLVGLVKQAAASFKNNIEKKGLDFNFKKPKIKTPQVNIDEEKVKLAIQNILENAISYTQKGSIKVEVSFSAPKKEFLVSVKDTGIGIPRSQQKRVFSRFFRAGNAIKVDTEGSGLGLYIAKNVVEAHGGRIWFHSEENKGSSFFFTIPSC